MNAPRSNPPTAALMPPPDNCWYVVAFSDEISTKPMARRILNKRMALYRTEGGLPVMMDDYCPHRAMALSQGQVVNGDRLQCPYHGLEFGPSGMCAHVPSQTAIPSPMKVRSYPMVEKWQWVWAWMGSPELADESLIPDHNLFGFAGGDEYWTIQRFVMNITGSYQLLHENLLDLSHVSYLHAGSFDAGGMALAEPTMDVQGHVITVGRTITETMTGAFARIFELPDGSRMERELITRAWVPNLNVVTNHFRDPANPSAKTLTRHAPFAITPETPTTCHYFVGMASNYADYPTPEKLARANQTVREIFLTDQAAIEAIQQAYLELGSAVPDTSLRADAAALRFRRILATVLEEDAKKKTGKVTA